jgi:hypothetical protein
MNSTSPVVRLIAEQRKRCLATIFSNAEAALWWKLLEADERDLFKDQVRQALSVFYDLVRDVVKVSEDDGVRNEIALDLIRDIHTRQRQILTAITEPSDGDTDG